MPRLIETISEVQEHVRVGNGLDFKTLTPALNEVEMQDLTFYLGKDLLDEIIAQKYSMPQEYTERIGLIAPHVITAAVCLAVYKAGPEIEVLVNESGIMRTETASEKSAFGGQVKRFRDTAADRGYRALDAFLLLLEDNAEDYPEWYESQYYKQRRGLMIRSALEFEQAGEYIKGSSLTFKAMRSIILGIQEQRIRQSLPDAMYLEIINQLESDELSADNQILLDRYIRPAIAKLAIEEALTQLPVNVDHEAVTVNQLELATDSRTSTTAPLHLVEKKAWSLRGQGEFYLGMMKEYLNQQASAAKYPLWFVSAHYAETLDAKILRHSMPDIERRIYRG